MIKIHYDFSDGTELLLHQAKEALIRGESFTTHCTNFFNTDNLECMIVCEDGRYMSVSELLENNKDQYTDKQIRKSHNLEQLFLSGCIKWEKFQITIDISNWSVAKLIYILGRTLDSKKP